MIREELKAHCERQIQRFELVEKKMPVTPNDWKRYEEHKLILELLEQETVSKESYDHEYFLRKEFEIKIAKLEQAFDKLRAEIETKYGHCDICEYFEDYDYEENAISEYRPIGDIADILQIIDKYKAETEDA